MAAPLGSLGQVNAGMWNCVLLKHHRDPVEFSGTKSRISSLWSDPQGFRPGMPTREEYLHHAEECVALALKAADPEARTRLLEMAQAWRDLADKFRRSSPDGGPSG